MVDEPIFKKKYTLQKKDAADQRVVIGSDAYAIIEAIDDLKEVIRHK